MAIELKERAVRETAVFEWTPDAVVDVVWPLWRIRYPDRRKASRRARIQHVQLSFGRADGDPWKLTQSTVTARNIKADGTLGAAMEDHAYGIENSGIPGIAEVFEQARALLEPKADAR